MPRTARATARASAPAAWLQKATVNAGRRRDWMPPKKSAAPQHKPELSPSGTPRFTGAHQGSPRVPWVSARLAASRCRRWSAGDGAPAVAPARGVPEAGAGVDGEQERGQVEDEQTEHEPDQFHWSLPGFVTGPSSEVPVQ